jgi:hypothetical protein
MGKNCFPPVLDTFRSIGFAAVIGAVALPGFARDLEGRCKDSPLRDWFDHLASGKVSAVRSRTVYVVQDANWKSRDATIVCGCQGLRTPKMLPGSMYRMKR